VEYCLQMARLTLFSSRPIAELYLTTIDSPRATPGPPHLAATHNDAHSSPPILQSSNPEKGYIYFLWQIFRKDNTNYAHSGQIRLKFSFETNQCCNKPLERTHFTEEMVGRKSQFWWQLLNPKPLQRTGEAVRTQSASAPLKYDRSRCALEAPLLSRGTSLIALPYLYRSVIASVGISNLFSSKFSLYLNYNIIKFALQMP